MDQIKWYLVQVGMKKYVPMAVMAGIGTLAAYLAAHAGMLEQYGITSGTWPLQWPTGQQPSGPVILLELDTLGAKAIAGIAALASVAVAAVQHHTSDPPTIPGGRREIDPPGTPPAA